MVKQYLTAMNIEYVVDSTLVRGLDYYNHTAFEIMSEAEGFGAITTLCGGGRYNGLVQEMGGPDTPGIGFALSIERLISALEAEKVELQFEKKIDCYLVSLGERSKGIFGSTAPRIAPSRIFIRKRLSRPQVESPV